MNYNTSKKLYKNAIKRIINRMPKSLSEIEKARYMYVNLGRLFTYDENYWYSNKKISNKIYKKSLSSPIDLNDLHFEAKTKDICININKTYNKLLNILGINTQDVMSYIGDGHISTMFFIGKKRYCCDLQSDLKFIQLKLKTHSFACDGPNVLSEDELKSIDTKIGYSNIGEKFEEKLLKDLRIKLCDYQNIGDKMLEIFKTVQKMPGHRELEYAELQALYTYFINNSLCSKDKLNIHSNLLYKENSPDKRTDYRLVYSSFDNTFEKNSFRRFIFSNNDSMFHEISNEDLNNLIVSNNYKILCSGKIPGLNKIINKTNLKTYNNLNNKHNKHNDNMDLDK